tara:strand:+ start:358 stop:939 length:582 start_codon:yes stop_codon:yes gene_type:complete
MEIILIGSGTHLNVLIDILNSYKKYQLMGYISNKENLDLKLNYLGDDNEFKKNNKSTNNTFINGIGSIKQKNNFLRNSIFNFYRQFGKFENILHKTAFISKGSFFDEGFQILMRSSIGINVKIGKNVLINSGVIIEHDCIIEDNVIISPGSTICGGVTIKKNSFIGASSTIIQNINISENSFIKSNALVSHDV